MIGCRKIYSNLLLLSVMLFMLGGAVRPVVPGWSPGTCHCSWCEPDSHRPFQWETAGTPLVYRQVHSATILSAADHELLIPEKPFELAQFKKFTAFYEISGGFTAPEWEVLCAPRAPPGAA